LTAKKDCEVRRRNHNSTNICSTTMLLFSLLSSKELEREEQRALPILDVGLQKRVLLPENSKFLYKLYSDNLPRNLALLILQSR